MSEMTMVERVARALCRRRIEWNRRQDEKPFPSEERIQAGVNHAWPDFVDEARAAIAAMREPDSAMRQAALAYCEGCHKRGDTPNLEGYWQAVFDEALR